MVTLTATLLDKLTLVEVASDSFLISIKFEQLKPQSVDELGIQEATADEAEADSEGSEEDEVVEDEESDSDDEAIDSEDAVVEGDDEEDTETDVEYAKFEGVVIDGQGENRRPLEQEQFVVPPDPIKISTSLSETGSI